MAVVVVVLGVAVRIIVAVVVAQWRVAYVFCEGHKGCARWPVGSDVARVRCIKVDENGGVGVTRECHFWGVCEFNVAFGADCGHW